MSRAALDAGPAWPRELQSRRVRPDRSAFVPAWLRSMLSRYLIAVISATRLAAMRAAVAAERCGGWASAAAGRCGSWASAAARGVIDHAGSIDLASRLDHALARAGTARLAALRVAGVGAAAASRLTSSATAAATDAMRRCTSALRALYARAAALNPRSHAPDCAPPRMRLLRRVATFAALAMITATLLLTIGAASERHPLVVAPRGRPASSSHQAADTIPADDVPDPSTSGRAVAVAIRSLHSGKYWRVVDDGGRARLAARAAPSEKGAPLCRLDPGEITSAISSAISPAIFSAISRRFSAIFSVQARSRRSSCWSQRAIHHRVAGWCSGGSRRG